MTNILAIETSSDACSVAVSNGKTDYYFHEIIPKQHTERLLEVIDNLFKTSSIKTEDLNLVAVGNGPGSFTGIRLACSTAQGIALSQNIKGVCISSLELLAYKMFKNHSAKRVVSIVDAHMGKIYLGEFSFIGSEIDNKNLSAVQIESFNPVKYDESTYFVGPGCELVEQSISSVSKHIYSDLPSAEELLELAKEKHEKKEIVIPEQLLPLYLSEESNWTKS